MSAGRALLKSAVGAARYRLTGHRVPLAVALCVTRRSDSMCLYRDVPMLPSPELSALEVLQLLDELAHLGCTRVNFGTGEPLERPELPAFVRRCREHGMWTVVETSGHALPLLVDELPASRFMVALDGGQAAHDLLREPGSFLRATAGIRAARAAGVAVGTTTVLTRHNLHDVPHLLDLADALGFDASFQLLDPSATRAAGRARPGDDALRRTLRWLLEAKVSGRRVAMSEKALRYLLDWPDYAHFRLERAHEDVTCMAGQVSCAVDADGSVYPCTPRMAGTPVGNLRDEGFPAAFERLRDNTCRACVSTACTEASFLYNFNKPALVEVARVAARGAAGERR